MSEPSWRADPTGRHQLRLFDRNVWTEQVSDDGVAGIDPISPAKELPRLVDLLVRQVEQDLRAANDQVLGAFDAYMEIPVRSYLAGLIGAVLASSGGLLRHSAIWAFKKVVGELDDVAYDEVRRRLIENQWDLRTPDVFLPLLIQFDDELRLRSDMAARYLAGAVEVLRMAASIDPVNAAKAQVAVELYQETSLSVFDKAGIPPSGASPDEPSSTGGQPTRVPEESDDDVHALATELRQAAHALARDTDADLRALGVPLPDEFRITIAGILRSLVAAMLTSDGFVSPREFAVFEQVFGPLMGRQTIEQARRQEGFMATASHDLHEPDPILLIILMVPGRAGAEIASRYVTGTVELMRLAASIDSTSSEHALPKLDLYYEVSMRAFDSAAAPRPGVPEAAGSGAARVPVAEQVSARRALEEIVGELDSMIGLEPVKHDVRALVNTLRIQQMRAERGMPALEMSHHVVFTGNPGTGKTTVARLWSEVMHTLGFVSKGHLVETDRSGLVAGYVGQTAQKTLAVLERARGGTLLIDEAYSLNRDAGNDFGQEAIDTLVKYMEDHRDDLTVVVAGYPDEMEAFIKSNPGLASRFNQRLHFPDYSDDELVAIYARLCERHQYSPSDEVLARVRQIATAEPRGEGFGNARFMRNVFESALRRQATRLSAHPNPTDADLSTLVLADLGQ